MMYKEEILANENRRKIYEVIEANPGIHLRELQRVLDMPLTTLEYHLNYMNRKQLIYAENDANVKRYYAKPLDKSDKVMLSALRQQKMREIVLMVISNKKVSNHTLYDDLKLPRSTLSFYLKTLVDKGILAKEKIGYDTLYTVKDEERVCRIITAYKETLLDKIVNKTLNFCLETYFKERLK
jgi:predicted transcriptional regulator